MEVLAISTLLLLVIAEFSPGVSILLFSGVFITQTILNVFDNEGYRQKYQKAPLDNPDSQGGRCSGISAACCSVSSKLLAFILQCIGLFGLIGYCVYRTVVLGAAAEYRAMIGMPLAIIVLSVVWSSRCQKYIARSNNSHVSARYKSSKRVYNSSHNKL